MHAYIKCVSYDVFRDDSRRKSILANSLDSGDVALDGSSAPRIPKGVRDCLQVIGHTRRQTRERLQVAGRRIQQPLREGRHVQVVECGTETLNELVAGVEQRIRCQDTLEIGTFLVFEQLR